VDKAVRHVPVADVMTDSIEAVWQREIASLCLADFVQQEVEDAARALVLAVHEAGCPDCGRARAEPESAWPGFVAKHCAVRCSIDALGVKDA
jgi:hypothetical protein